MTKIVNCKKEKYDIYCGRPSDFGNPMSIQEIKRMFLGISDEVAREKAILWYRKYFYKRIKADKNFLEKVLKLKDKTLGCFCKPLSCHCDIIAEFLDKNDENL